MIDTEYRWLRPRGRLIVYSAPEDAAALDLMAAPRDAQLIVAGTRETAVLPPVVKLVDSGFLDRELYLDERQDLADIERAFSSIDRGSVVKALIRLN
jgi:Zn-dependent alcohol dehydrogenase